MNYIESKENSFFKNTKKLKEKKFRVKEGKFLLEGLRLVEEAIKAEAKIENIIIDEKVKDKISEEKYIKSFDEKKIVILSSSLFAQITQTETPQGVVAVVKNPEAKLNLEGSFYVVCDKVQDPGNLGTIIRTSHAAGVDGIILTKGSADIYNDKTLRSTMGSIFYVPVFYDDEDFTTIKELQAKGFSLVVTSLQESRNFFEEDLKGKTMVTVGNEGNGVSNEIMDLSNKRVKIPMPGGAESLNVAIATSIILFEKVRQNSINK